MGHAMRIEMPSADSPLGLEFPDSLTFDQWESQGRRLSQTSHALQWYIGDWWNAGVKFGDEKRAETAKRLFALEYQTVRNLGSICGRVPVYRRRDSLSFSHHAELAAIDDEGKVEALTRQVEEQGMSVRDLRREVQALKASNDPAAGEPVPQIRATPKPNRTELEEAYSRYVEAMEALEAFRPLSRREADFMAVALNALGEAHAERRPPPDDFDIVFVEQGRIACEPWYRASRITVNRWLIQRGKKRLLDQRALFVKHQRSKEYPPAQAPTVPVPAGVDVLLPVAKLAAAFMRQSRHGGWPISMAQDGDGWIVGTTRKTSEDLIRMAERQGFDRAEAEAEANGETYDGSGLGA